MGHQILIIALTGTHNPALPAELTKQLATQGLQIRHACLSYEGRTTFAVGAADELARELAEAGHPTSIIDTAQAGESITLETLLEEVRAHHTAFRKFAAYEKKDDKESKEPKPRGKKEAPAPPATTGPEVTSSAQPETTEAVTAAAPEVNSAPIPSEAPDAKENNEATGNKES